VAGNQVHHPPLIFNRSGPAPAVERVNFQVRVETENLFSRMIAGSNPLIDADDNDEHRDAEGDARMEMSM